MLEFTIKNFQITIMNMLKKLEKKNFKKDKKRAFQQRMESLKDYL